MKGLFVFVTLVATLCIVPQLWAKTFYLKNGEQIKYQRYWQKEGRVYLLINRDTLVDFAPEEVDLEKTVKAAKTGVVKKKATHKKHVKPHAAQKAAKPACPAAEEKKPAPAALPPSAAKPAPAVKPAPAAKPAPAVKPMPARPAASAAAPAPVKSANTQPGSPALQNELAAIYAKCHAAMRAGDVNEQARYAAAKQRKHMLESMAKATDKEKAQLKAMMKAMVAKSYSVTGCTVAPDGKSATLNLRGKIDFMGKEQDNDGAIDFVREGNEWKIEMVTWKAKG